MKLISRDLGVRYSAALPAKRALEEFVRSEDPEWRAGSVHPARTQFPPERPEGVPVPAQARHAEDPREPPPFQSPPVQGPPAEPAARATAEGSLRRAWLRPARVGPSLALAALAVLVLAFLLHRPAPPQPSPVVSSAPAEQPPASSPLAEKPTIRLERLPSPLPTQQEASPSVNQSDTSPTLTHGTPNAQQRKRTHKRRPSKAGLCALLIAALEWHAAGCTGVQTRPDPGDCPKEAVRAMQQELGWNVWGGTAALILLDVTKGTEKDAYGKNQAVYKDGPVTGALVRAEGNAPVETRLDGHLWTTGDRIYGRYVRARLPGGRVVPVCIELTEGGGRFADFGLPKEEGSRPGHTVGPMVSGATVVDRWR
jgi:hypothetical protein